jgi:hypothetical protein
MAQSDKEGPTSSKTASPAKTAAKDSPLAGIDLDGGRTAGASPTAAAEPDLKVQIVEPAGAQAEPPEVTEDNITEDATGEKVDRTISDESQFLRNVTNVDLAPVPREQVDEDVRMDPMKRQPGVAPSAVPTQEGEVSTTAGRAVEEETVDFSMTMPYWDGRQMYERGTVLPFKPSEAPFGAKRVVPKKD